MNIWAAPIDPTTAAKVAANFYHQQTMAKTLFKQQAKPALLDVTATTPYQHMYVFNAEGDNGFVLVAGDDRSIPVLGYSDEGRFDYDNLPDNARAWIAHYEEELAWIVENDAEPYETTAGEWTTLVSGGLLETKGGSVEPLIKTKWDQAPYYNDKCPTNIFAPTGHTYTGCVATAMAQVMKYWNFPIRGRGYNSYHCSYYGTQSANFANTTYDWSHMPNQLSSSSSTTQVNAVATLIYHCGVSVNMDYGINGSGITDISLVVKALKNNFYYDTSIRLVEKNQYSDASWVNLLKTELDNGRPIFHCGSGSKGGHAFVCDGYNGNNYFHFNWGWSGSCDGYYSTSDLTPGTGGAGAGNGSYTTDQCAVIGIKPSNNTSPEIEMYSTLKVNDVWYGSDITGTIQILNAGISSFSGKIGVIIFNEEEIAVSGQVFNVSNLQYNYYTTGTVKITGGGALIPGTYYAYALYSTDGESWDLIPNGTNAKPYTTFKISYSALLETNSDFSTTTLIQGQKATVNADILNSSTSTFYGKVRINLANIEDGSFVQNIQIINITNGLKANYHYSNGLDFTGNITATPGTYLMELAFQRDGESQWYYAGSSNYQNPVFVTVVAPPTLAVSASSLSFQASGESTMINVISNVNWTATSSASWLTIYPNSGTESGYMIVTASANTSNSTRSATITVSGSNGAASKTITVSQDANTGNQPDSYEPNNTVATAYNLGTIQSTSKTFTINASLHTINDIDFYKIYLPEGYDYTVSASHKDFYNSALAACTKMFFSEDGSTMIQAKLHEISPVTINNGGIVYFKVIGNNGNSYDVGDYELTINITRSGTSSPEPDSYEPNNTVATAYNLGTIQTDSKTFDISANFHTETDLDYYKIELPTGYKYTISAIKNDANNSSYTGYATMHISLDGTTTAGSYDSEMPAKTINNGGTIYFKINGFNGNSYDIGTYQLSIFITRTEEPSVSPDSYETNNTVATAAYIGSVTSNRTFTINATLHTASDVDYYKINLPAEYKYTISANKNDYFNSSHTARTNMYFSSDGSTMTGPYNPMPPTTINNGGNIYFKINGYNGNNNDIGTYQLIINVSRISNSGIEEVKDDEFVLYPNPAINKLYLTMNGNVEVMKIELLNATGQLLRTYNGNEREFNVGDLPSGLYFMRIVSTEGVTTKKWIKQ